MQFLFAFDAKRIDISKDVENWEILLDIRLDLRSLFEKKEMTLIQIQSVFCVIGFGFDSRLLREIINKKEILI